MLLASWNIQVMYNKVFIMPGFAALLLPCDGVVWHWLQKRPRWGPLVPPLPASGGCSELVVSIEPRLWWSICVHVHCAISMSGQAATVCPCIVMMLLFLFFCSFACWSVCLVIIILPLVFLIQTSHPTQKSEALLRTQQLSSTAHLNIYAHLYILSFPSPTWSGLVCFGM